MKLFRKKRRSVFSKTNILPIFVQQTVLLKEASQALCKMTDTNDHEQWKKLEREVKKCETQGDSLLEKLYEEIYETFLPPMDRDDIQTTAMEVDIFLDQINTCAKSLLLYLPGKIDRQLVDMAQYIASEALALNEIVSFLDGMKSNFSAISMQCDRITELEHAADEAYEEYIGEIFRTEKNAIELMKYKNIAEAMEGTTDTAKRISDHIRKILLRYV